MSFGNDQSTDQARKYINIAKFILSEILEARITSRHQAAAQEMAELQ
jgi:hypothetical protein